MKLGDEVKIEGTLAKNGSNRGNARSVTMVSTGRNSVRHPAKAKHRSFEGSERQYYRFLEE